MGGVDYEFRVTALTAGGGQSEPAAIVVRVPPPPETMSAPVRSLAATAVSSDAVRLRWDGPAGWLPVGYVLQWRRYGAEAFGRRLELPAGRREQTVTGLVGGVDYEFRVTALTAWGGQSEPAAVGARTPPMPETTLRIEVDAPTYCIAHEGGSGDDGAGGPNEDGYWVRTGVPSVPVQWRVSGGQAPYTVRIGGVETRAVEGVADVTCARAGVDLNRLEDPDTDVVESGPKTITLQAVDAAGATLTRTHVVEVIEFLRSVGTFAEGVTLKPGRTYYLWEGNTTRGRFLETLEGEVIAFSEYRWERTVHGPRGLVVFRHVMAGDRHTEAAFEERTGERVGIRVVFRKGPDSWDTDADAVPTRDETVVWDRFEIDAMRDTPFPAGDPRNEAFAPVVEEQSDLPDDPTARAIITCGTDFRCLQYQFDCSVVDPDCVGRRLDEYFSSGVDGGD